MRGFKPEDSGRVADEGQQDAAQNLHFSPTCGMQESEGARCVFLAELAGALRA